MARPSIKITWFRDHWFKPIMKCKPRGMRPYDFLAQVFGVDQRPIIQVEALERFKILGDRLVHDTFPTPGLKTHRTVFKGEHLILRADKLTKYVDIETPRGVFRLGVDDYEKIKSKLKVVSFRHRDQSARGSA